MVILYLYIPVVSFAAPTSGKVNQLFALDVTDTSINGSSIYDDMLSGKIQVVSYSWKSSNESVTKWSSNDNISSFVRFTKPGEYTVSYDLEYSYPGESKSHIFSYTWDIVVSEERSTSYAISINEVNCSWGMTREQVISTQKGGYHIIQNNETSVIFTKILGNKDEVFIAYKFDNDRKLCASTLSIPESKETKLFSDEIFSQYNSEMSIEDGLEVKTNDSNLIAVDVSSTVNGGNIISIGFSYIEAQKERDDCVDLGLSVRWATMNLGANKPTGVGGFYAFSETSTKSEYWRENYSFCNNNSNKYVFNYTNPLTNICGTKYDAATKKLGDGWRMPSLLEVNELISKCKWEKDTVDGTSVFRVTGPNGNSIILPIVGYKKQDKDHDTSKLRMGIGECPSKSSDEAYILTAVINLRHNTCNGSVDSEWKAWGYNIRPVYTK